MLIKSLFDFYFRTLKRILDDNIPSTSSSPPGITENILTYDSAENMTVTPDITLPNDDSVSTLIQPKPVYYLVPDVVHDEPTETSLVTPETGFHFLFSSEQTVDLTTTEENQKK